MAYTFTTLKQAIQDYTENTETTFVNNLSRFIQNAEERLYKTLQIPSLREVVDSTLISGQRFVNKPANFQYIYSIAVKESDGDYVFLLDKDANFLREAFPNPSTTGFPQYYANHDDEHFYPSANPQLRLRGSVALCEKPNINYHIKRWNKLAWDKRRSTSFVRLSNRGQHIYERRRRRNSNV